MKFILIGALMAVGALLLGLYFCFAIFFKVNAQYRNANRQLSQPESTNRGNSEVAQPMKAKAGK